ncbi:DUF5677 domain-containing protein [Paractinoplanes hotanensis]|uniref:DUF5677 domain-containing protein n=1 Tax=Paractinoplanes hotanensis TaxID=2906497 RepID=UPI0034DB1ADD
MPSEREYQRCRYDGLAGPSRAKHLEIRRQEDREQASSGDMSRQRLAPSLPIEVYREVIDELMAAWDRFDGFDTRTKDLPTARVTFALVANAYRAGRAASTLWESDLWAESMPNVRACFESAVSAAWTQQTGKSGVDATMYERSRQAVNLMTTAELAEVGVPEELRDQINDEAKRTPAPARAAQARAFPAMCKDLQAGNSLYLMYRHTSDAAHAPSAVIRHLVAGPGDRLVQVKQPAASEGLRKWPASLWHTRSSGRGAHLSRSAFISQASSCSGKRRYDSASRRF